MGGEGEGKFAVVCSCWQWFAMVSSLSGATQLGFAEVVDPDGEVVGLIENRIGGVTAGETEIVGENKITRRFHE